MNVLIILEDALKDQFIGVPIIDAAFQFIKRHAKVTALKDRMGSVEQAMDFDRLKVVIEEWQGMVDLFLLLVDRDCCAPGRPRGGDRVMALSDLEERIQEANILGPHRRFIASHAIEELEVWLLAGFKHQNWQAIRDECDPKETYFEHFSQARGLFEEPAEGRRKLMEEAIPRYRRIRHLCPELQALEQRFLALGGQ